MPTAALNRLFKKAALCLTLGAGAINCVSRFSLKHDAARQRPYTQGELHLINTFFDGHINPDKAALIMDYTGNPPSAVTGKPAAAIHIDLFIFGQQIRMYSRHSDDYSDLNKPPRELDDFMHEMTHVWQSQNIGYFNMNRDCPSYEYNLDLDLFFFEFCHERQAAMVGDYVQRFLHPAKEFPRNSLGDVKHAEERLKNKIETIFPGARKLRMERGL